MTCPACFSPALFDCPKCGTAITVDDYLGADPPHENHFYHCKVCGLIIMVNEHKRPKEFYGK